MGQPVAFFEIVSPDAERARKFYTEMFGWTAQADLPEGYGRFAIFTDPDGNQVGLWA